jgi:hypothetical protein
MHSLDKNWQCWSLKDCQIPQKIKTVPTQSKNCGIIVHIHLYLCRENYTQEVDCIIMLKSAVYSGTPVTRPTMGPMSDGRVTGVVAPVKLKIWG